MPVVSAPTEDAKVVKMVKKVVEMVNKVLKHLKRHPITSTAQITQDVDVKDLRHLCGLPPEIRVRIWELALHEETDITLTRRCDDCADANPEPALLRVCKQVRNEALPVFEKENTLHRFPFTSFKAYYIREKIPKGPRTSTTWTIKYDLCTHRPFFPDMNETALNEHFTAEIPEDVYRIFYNGGELPWYRYLRRDFQEILREGLSGFKY